MSYDVLSLLVKALYSAPTASISFESAFVVGRFFVPLNMRCSMKCETPLTERCSCRDPTLYITSHVTECVSWRGTKIMTLPSRREIRLYMESLLLIFGQLIARDTILFHGVAIAYRYFFVLQ